MGAGFPGNLLGRQVEHESDLHTFERVGSLKNAPNAPARAYWPRVLGRSVSTLPADGDHYTFLRPPLAAEADTSILKWHRDFE